MRILDLTLDGYSVPFSMFECVCEFFYERASIDSSSKQSRKIRQSTVGWCVFKDLSSSFDWMITEFLQS